MRFYKLLILSIFLLAACTTTGSLPSTPSPQDIQTAIAQTAAANAPTPSPMIEADAEPTSTTEPIPSPTFTPSDPITGRVNVSFLNLRTGPSTLFPVLKSFEASTELLIQRRVATNEWIEVKVEIGDDEFIGWMLASLVESDGDILNLEVFEFPEDQIIQGRVEDSNANPIDNITIALIIRIDEEEFRSDSSSNASGDFTFYIPEDVNAILDIQIVGIGCESIIVNSSCSLEGFFNLERRAFINPPQSEPILFIYEIATTTLTGTIYNPEQSTVANVLVIAERDDGAESYGTSSINGAYEIPIGEGIWEVYTVILDPRLESERVNLTITNQTLTPLDLTTP